MVIEDLLDKPYEEYTVMSLVWYECDYCGKKFQKLKKTREKLNKHNPKDSCGGKDCTNKKRTDTYIIRFGTENPQSLDSQKEKIKKLNIEKFGNESYFQTDEFKSKRKSKLIENLGVDSPLKSQEIIDKIKDTCVSKYGVDNYSKTNEFKERVKKSSQEKFGTDSPMQNPDVIKKREETCLEKYGVKNYIQTDEYWDKRKKTCLEKYGVEHSHQLEEIRKKQEQTCIDRYGVKNYAQSNESKERYIKTCLDKYGVPNPLCLQQNQVYGKTQKLIREWLLSLGFEFQQDYSVLEKQEIDLFSASLKVGIEYCGLYWHNELSPTKKDSRYHYNKYKACKDQNVELITIFEDEWYQYEDKCKSILKSKLGLFDSRIYARKCTVVEVDKEYSSVFFDSYHIQCSSKRSIVVFGLIYNNEVVGTISLGHHPRLKLNDSIVLDRFCFKTGIQVIGGASKLLNACSIWARDNNYKSIITWSDNRWSGGDVYSAIGFKLDDELSPDYSYVDLHNVRKGRISKQSQKKSNTGCPIDKTEHEWAIEHGLARIWDCGKKRWKLNL